MKNQQKLKPRIPVQAAPVTRQGEGKMEKGGGPSWLGVVGVTPVFAADDAE